MRENRLNPDALGRASRAPAAVDPELNALPGLADLVVVSVRHGHSTPLSELLARGEQHPAAAI